MKPRIAAVCVVVANALLLAGCGTVDNLCCPNQQTGQVPLHVYGGVTADVQFLTDDRNTAQINQDALLPLRLLYLADLPLTFVADTATLPLTLPLACYDSLAHRNPQQQQQPTIQGASPLKTVPMPPGGVPMGGPPNPSTPPTPLATPP